MILVKYLIEYGLMKSNDFSLDPVIHSTSANPLQLVTIVGNGIQGYHLVGLSYLENTHRVIGVYDITNESIKYDIVSGNKTPLNDSSVSFLRKRVSLLINSGLI